MSFFGNAAGHKALIEHNKGNLEKAAKQYEEAFAKGADKASIFLGYALLLSRLGEWEKAVEYLRKAEKARDVTADQKQQVVLHYAVLQSKLGNLARGIELLRQLFQKNKTGLLYQALGYMLIETGDADEALAFNLEAYDYDDEDAITVDNLAQTYYRLLGDKETAKKYFDKAYELKSDGIDTLYFLALYDIDAGNKDAAREKLEKALEGRRSALNYATKERIEALLEKV